MEPLPAQRRLAFLQDAGPMFAFFLVVYLIIVLKTATVPSIVDHWFFGFYSLLITTYILSRFLLSHFHAAPRADPAYRPSVTFVVPAKNEEDNIRETMRKFSEVDYPPELIEVIAVNDGSTDRTLEEMRAAALEIRARIARVEVIHWDRNRGKRHGMAEGVRRARHDIIIFIDSDSFIEPDCVTHLVKYFADPAVGAVSGHTDVHNDQVNFLTRMQAIRYYLAFRVYKAAESVFGAVTCCPGCCSAYRRAYLAPILDEWLTQRFLGGECTFGDDRSLTNFILRKYEAVYAPEARARTVVPEKFATYVRQQQRWKKSWIRETFIACGFMWRKHPLAAVSFYTYVFLAFASPVVFARAMIWNPLATASVPLVYLAGLFLMLMLHGLYYRLYTGPKSWLMAIVSFWFNSVVLMWQLPWALITLKDSRWGTR